MNKIKLLRPASFRGISFNVEDADGGFGRRIVTHQYPGKDQPYHEDMGADVDSFSIEAFISGPDFISRAASLEAALKRAGPGTFIHPLKGEIQVIVLSARRRQSSNAVGEVTFSISFERHGGPTFPLSAADTAAGLFTSANTLLSAIASDFSGAYAVAGFPDFVAGDASGRLSAFSDSLKSVLSSSSLLSYVPGEWPGFISTAENLASAVTGFFSTIGMLGARKPVSPVGGSFIESTPAPALPLANAMVAASAISTSDDFPESDTSRRAVNAAAIDNLFQLSALAAAAHAARSAQYESREQAISFREKFADRVDIARSSAGAGGFHQSYRAATALMAAVTRDINERIGRLPRTTQIKTVAIRSSLELANRLYGDTPGKIVATAADLARRNRAGHPGFVPAGILEVLIDASAS